MSQQQQHRRKNLPLHHQRHLASEVLVLSALGPPVPAPVWRCLASAPRSLAERLFVALEERRHVRRQQQLEMSNSTAEEAVAEGQADGVSIGGCCYATLEEDTAALLAKLVHLGLQDGQMEDRLLALRDLALKVGIFFLPGRGGWYF